MTTQPSPATGPILSSLKGAAPPAMIRQWRVFTQWPAAALADTWSFLKPVLVNPRDTRAADALREFCKRHGLGRREVGEVGSTLHTLVLNAAAGDLSDAAFAKDLVELGGGEGASALLGGYDAAKQAVRLRLLRAALTEHGKVMTGVAWRVDQVTDSDAAKNLASTVLVLTFSWQEGETKGRTTLQLTSDATADLRAILQKFNV